MMESSHLSLCAASLLALVISHQLFEGPSPDSPFFFALFFLHVLTLRRIHPSARKVSIKVYHRAQADAGLPFAITMPAWIRLDMLVFRTGADIDKHAPPPCPSKNATHMHANWQPIYVSYVCYILAGMLIYTACIGMLATDFVMEPTLWRGGWVRQALAVGSLMLGVCAMGVIS